MKGAAALALVAGSLTTLAFGAVPGSRAAHAPPPEDPHVAAKSPSRDVAQAVSLPEATAHTGLRVGRRAAARCSLEGTHLPDTIFGTDAAEIICAGSGADVIRAGGGADTVRGAAGRDVIRGGAGSDTLFGGSGSDRFWTRDGRRDRIHGGEGLDCVAGYDPVDLVGSATRGC